MRKSSNAIWWIVGGGVALVALAGGKSYVSILSDFFPAVEGFSPTPYWDYKQWSWGYGTRVPGSTNNPGVRPSGTITRTQGMQDALFHVNQDYNYLKPLVHVGLTPKQWAALLSFSYNEGPGNADNLMTNLNNQDWSSLEDQWKKYIYAGGVVNSDLIDRRNKEWQLFSS